VYDVHLLRFWN